MRRRCDFERSTVIPIFRSGDRIELSGKSGHTLEGALQPEGREVFKEGNQNVKYALKFSSQ
jgi:hypothetical protein